MGRPAFFFFSSLFCHPDRSGRSFLPFAFRERRPRSGGTDVLPLIRAEVYIISHLRRRGPWLVFSLIIRIVPILLPLIQRRRRDTM